MKNLVIALSLVSSSLVFASGMENVVKGNIYFPGQGQVSADKVCFDKNSNLFRAVIPAHYEESCSIAALPLWKCTEVGGSIIKTYVPQNEISTARTLNVKECVRYNMNDTTHPVCVSYREVQKLQPLDFDFMKYQVEIISSYNAPREYEVRDMLECD